MTERKIHTYNVAPPIPCREFDWCAWYDGDEEHGPRGWGATEAEAITDLKDNYEDEPDPDRMREDRDERRRLEKEFPND